MSVPVPKIRETYIRLIYNSESVIYHSPGRQKCQIRMSNNMQIKIKLPHIRVSLISFVPRATKRAMILIYISLYPNADINIVTESSLLPSSVGRTELLHLNFKRYIRRSSKDRSPTSLMTSHRLSALLVRRTILGGEYSEFSRKLFIHLFRFPCQSFPLRIIFVMR